MADEPNQRKEKKEEKRVDEPMEREEERADGPKESDEEIEEETPDPYREGGERKKAGDFFLGFFLNIVGVLGSSVLLFIIESWIFLVAIIDITLIIRYFVTNRRYIAIGMISSILIPLVIVGGCFIVIFW
jgi:Flp pilus assembly protein TadB